MDKKKFVLLGRLAQRYPEVSWNFVRKINFDAVGGCWEWTGARTKLGYGQFNQTSKGTTNLPHRIAYTLIVGPIPDGLVLDHLCRNPPCINPDHLEPVTHDENIARGYQATKTLCVNGHPLEGINLYRDANGNRECRECRASRSKKWLDSGNRDDWNRARRERRGSTTGRYAENCKHGHPLSGDNLYINPKTGQRVCRACVNRRGKEYHERIKVNGNS